MDDVAVHVLVQMLIGEKAAKPLGLCKVVGGPVSMVFALDECVFQHSLKGLSTEWRANPAPPLPAPLR